MKYAVVTGGTSGIGLGVAKMLVSKGYYVFATYVSTNITEDIENFEAIKTDQTKREEVYNFINYVKSKTDHLDCLHCNAGMTIRKSFTEYTDKDWDMMMEVAVNSHYIMCREFFSIIPAGSRILFTGSQMGLNPHGTVLAYGVVKSTVHALCKNLVKVSVYSLFNHMSFVEGCSVTQNTYRAACILSFACFDYTGNKDCGSITGRTLNDCIKNLIYAVVIFFISIVIIIFLFIIIFIYIVIIIIIIIYIIIYIISIVSYFFVLRKHTAVYDRIRSHNTAYKKAHLPKADKSACYLSYITKSSYPSGKHRRRLYIRAYHQGQTLP